MDRPKYYPQYINKCYCQKMCYCESTEKPESTHPKFVKLRSESGFIKPKSERIPFSAPNSRCASSSSKRTQQQSGRTSGYEFEKSSNTSSELTMTNKRINYERAKQAFADPSVAYSGPKNNYNIPDSYNCHFYYHQPFCANIGEDRVKSVNDFRLRNAQECFSVLSRHSISERMGKYAESPKEHICEVAYRLNSRGLLSPVNAAGDGRQICEKTEELLSLAPKGGAPTNITRGTHKIILQISNGAQSTGSGNRMRAASKKNVPANSLALRYQRLA